MVTSPRLGLWHLHNFCKLCCRFKVWFCKVSTQWNLTLCLKLQCLLWKMFDLFLKRWIRQLFYTDTKSCVCMIFWGVKNLTIGLKRNQPLGIHISWRCNTTTSNWIKHFHVNKNFVHHLTKKFKHFMEKNNTKFCIVVLVSIYVICSLYKLMHASKYLHCFESQLSTLSYMNLCVQSIMFWRTKWNGQRAMT